MEDLLRGQAITVNFDDQIVYNQLDDNEEAIWSLLLASGYLKVQNIDYRGILWNHGTRWILQILRH